MSENKDSIIKSAVGGGSGLLIASLIIQKNPTLSIGQQTTLAVGLSFTGALMPEFMTFVSSLHFVSLVLFGL